MQFGMRHAGVRATSEKESSLNSDNKAETLQEKVAAIANVPVTTAINNMQQEYLAVAKRLRAHSLQVHGTILNMLQGEFQLRQDETKNAIQEHQHELALKQAAEQAKAQADLDKQQADIEKANRPTLATVGGQVARPQ